MCVLLRFCHFVMLSLGQCLWESGRAGASASASARLLFVCMLSWLFWLFGQFKMFKSPSSGVRVHLRPFMLPHPNIWDTYFFLGSPDFHVPYVPHRWQAVLCTMEIAMISFSIVEIFHLAAALQLIYWMNDINSNNNANNKNNNNNIDKHQAATVNFHSVHLEENFEKKNTDFFSSSSSCFWSILYHALILSLFCSCSISSVTSSYSLHAYSMVDFVPVRLFL